jgi:hypothetical protein
LASAAVISFDDLSDGDVISTQYADVTFTNAIALSAGMSLDESEFPPRSGTTVAGSVGGSMRIDFSRPMDGVRGYFTHDVRLTMSGFRADGASLGSTTTLSSSNLAISGDPGSTPNEFMLVPLGRLVSYIVITGDPSGGTFTLDDLTFAPSRGVPEPATLSLFVLGGIGLAGVRRATSFRRRRMMGEANRKSWTTR